MALPPVGVTAAVQNAASFLSSMTSINGAINQSVQTMQTAASKSSVLTKAYDAISKGAQAAANTVRSGSGVIQQAVVAAMNAVMTAIGAVISILTVAFVAAIGVASAALAGLYAVAVRAAPYGDIIEGFNGVTAAAGLTASTLVDQLQAASLGTISKLDLMKQTNTALIGTTRDLGVELGKNLPNLMKVAQHQADVLGKDTSEVFNDLVMGIRRGTARSIESIGVSIDMEEAQRAYAASIGVTVASLNDEQKSLALLNAVLLQTGVATGGLAQATLDAGDMLSRIGATITNIFDGIGLALQPALEAFLTIIQTILDGISGLIANALPYIQAIAGFVADALQPVLGIVTGFADQLSSPDLAKRFFVGAANTFGAFVAGVDSAASQIIAAVTVIAQAIADLLLGSSPPPKGPLSNMTTGAENTMNAWLDGFIGGFSIDPVNQVAKQVSDAMGSIATANRGQVEARLAALDKAVLPFQNRLTIIKSTFDAIKAAAQPALDAIDRQMGKATQSLLAGEAGADATVRSLDAQRDAIQGVLDAQQNVTDQAQIQLALVQAQQAQERALLGIRQAQLGPAQAVAKATQKAVSAGGGATVAKPKEEKPKEPAKGSGTPGASSPPLQAVGGAAAPAAQQSIAGVANLSPEFAAKMQLQNAYNDALGGAPAGLDTAMSGLQKQLGRIGSVSGTNNRFTKMLDPIIQTFKDLPSKLPDIVAQVGQWVTDNIVTPITTGTFDFTPLGTAVTNAINSALTTLGIDPNLIKTQIDTALASVKIGDTDLLALTQQIADQIGTAFTNVSTSLEPLRADIEKALAPVKDILDKLGTQIGDGLKTLGDGVTGFVNNLRGADTSGLVGLLKPVETAIGIIASVATVIAGATVKAIGQSLPPIGEAVKNFVNALSGLGRGGDEGFQTFLSGMGTGLLKLGEGLLGFPLNLARDIADGLGNLVGIDIEKGLASWGPAFDTLKTIISTVISNIVTNITNLPMMISQAVATVGQNIQQTIIAPIKAAIIDPIMNSFGTAFGGPEIPGSIAFMFAGIGKSISDALAPLGTVILDGFSSVSNFLTGTSDDNTTLSGIINMGLAFFQAFPAQIGDALSTVADYVWDTFVSPIIGMLNAVIDGFNSMKTLILSGLSKLASSAAGAFSFLPELQGQLLDASVALSNEAYLNPIPHISVTRPGAATGGMFGPGVFKVGERGTEMIASATKSAVFPASVTRAFMGLSSMMQPHSVPYAAPSVVNNSSSVSNDRSMTNYFTGVSNDRDVMRRLKMNGAFR